MKVYINRKPITGPWGGGNKTVAALSEKLQQNGHDVVYRLCDDIDIIFCFDPRSNNIGEWYHHLFDYKMRHGAKIIQRVGDLGTHGKPDLTELVKQSTKFSDFLIFPSEWARNYLKYSEDNCAVINNSPLKDFYNNRNIEHPKTETIKVVSHHWSPNIKKGFKYYKFLEQYIVEKNAKIKFTYIGATPPGLKFESPTNYYEPIGDNKAISELISQNDIYLTASEEEAGANHVLEALACGLPVVYHKNGGSIVDYCKDYGIGYDSYDSMIDSLNKVFENYEHFKKNVLKYTKTIDDVISEYIDIIECIK